MDRCRHAAGVGRSAEPSRCIGYLVSEFGEWWFHPGPGECPPELRINGRPVTSGDVRLGSDRAEVRLTGEPFTGPPDPGPVRAQLPAQVSEGSAHAKLVPATGAADRRDRVRRLVIGPIGTAADIQLNDLSVRPDHARVEIDTRGAWWVTANNGEVHVDGTSVSSALLLPGSRFTVGRHVVTVPGGNRARQALPVEFLNVTVDRGGRSLLDNVSLSIPAGEFVAVLSPNEASSELLLGLIVGGYRPHKGAVASVADTAGGAGWCGGCRDPTICMAC